MAGPTYTYTADTPQAANPMNQTASLIRSNFQAINELVGVNHVAFNTNNAGKHNSTTMEFQGSDPSTASTDLGLYTKATGSPNVAEIFYRYPNNGIINQLTPISSGGTVAATSGDGWCLFASGVLLKWGTASVFLQSNNINVIYPTGPDIPVYKVSVPYAKVSLTQSTSANTNFTQFATAPQGYGNTGFFLFSLDASPSTVTVNYFTIGV